MQNENRTTHPMEMRATRQCKMRATRQCKMRFFSNCTNSIRNRLKKVLKKLRQKLFYVKLHKHANFLLNRFIFQSIKHLSRILSLDPARCSSIFQYSLGAVVESSSVIKSRSMPITARGALLASPAECGAAPAAKDFCAFLTENGGL